MSTDMGYLIKLGGNHAFWDAYIECGAKAGGGGAFTFHQGRWKLEEVADYIKVFRKFIDHFRAHCSGETNSLL